MITPSEGRNAFRGEAIINWVGVRGFEPPMASHLLLWPPMGFTQTKAITGIYIWAVFRDNTVRPKWPMQGSEGRGRPGASSKSAGGAKLPQGECTRIEAPKVQESRR